MAKHREDQRSAHIESPLAISEVEAIDTPRAEEVTKPSTYVPPVVAGIVAEDPIAVAPKSMVPGYRVHCPKVGGFWAAKRHFEQGKTVTIKASGLSAADIVELEAADPRYLVVEKTTVEV